MIGGKVVLRLRSGSECVDLGLALLRAEWRSLARATAPWMVGAIVLTCLGWWLNPWFALVLSLFLGFLVQVPAVRIAASRASGQAALLDGTSTWRGMGILLRSGFLPGLGMLLSIFLGPLALWVATRIVFLPEVKLVEGVEEGAHGRMGQLLSRGGVRPFAAAFWWFAMLAYGAVAGEVTGQALVADLFQMGHPFGSLMKGDLTPYPLTGLLLVSPVWALVRFALYLDLRTRAESLDVFFALWSASERSQG